MSWRKIRKKFIEYVASNGFKKSSRSGSQNKNKETRGSMSKHTGELLPFVDHTRHLIRACCCILNYCYSIFNVK
jgi:hypothetical protein